MDFIITTVNFAGLGLIPVPKSYRFSWFIVSSGIRELLSTLVWTALPAFVFC
jgi:hypothetical protein